MVGADGGEVGAGDGEEGDGAIEGDGGEGTGDGDGDGDGDGKGDGDGIGSTGPMPYAFSPWTVNVYCAPLTSPVTSVVVAVVLVTTVWAPLPGSIGEAVTQYKTMGLLPWSCGGSNVTVAVVFPFEYTTLRTFTGPGGIALGSGPNNS